MVALFIVAQSCKEMYIKKRLLNKLWYMCVVKYYVAVKKEQTSDKFYNKDEPQKTLFLVKDDIQYMIRVI